MSLDVSTTESPDERSTQRGVLDVLSFSCKHLHATFLRFS